MPNRYGRRVSGHRTCRASARRGDDPRVLAVLAGALVCVLAQPAGAQERPDGPPPSRATDSGLELLERAAASARATPHSGEILWVTWWDDRSDVELVEVQRQGDDLLVHDPGQLTLELSRTREGGMVDHQQGWYLPLPPATRTPPAADLADKYRVAVVGRERLLDRATQRLEVRRRADDRLRELLWVDEATGLLLRRESYDGDTRLRLANYLKLDLGAEDAVRVDVAAGPVPLEQRTQGAAPVDDEGVAALRRAGWTLPAALDDGYRARGVFVVDAQDSEPVQLVYDDGLYTVSLFVQQGQPDWATLPAGSRPVHDEQMPADVVAYEWPGAMPSRIVWESGGATYTLVGDAPPAELRSLAASLPRDRARGLAQRMGDGLARLWSWVSPWS